MRAESGHAVTKEWNRNDAVNRSKKAARVVLFLVTCMCGFLLSCQLQLLNI